MNDCHRDLDDVILLNYPTDKQREELIRRGQNRVLRLMDYDPVTHMFTVSLKQLLAAGIDPGGQK